MTISFWRYSHLALAISSFLFLIIASLTGIVLALEPVSDNYTSYHVNGASSLTIAELLDTVGNQYEEVLSIRQDENDFIAISAITDHGDETFYINPFTGEKIGEIIERHAIFKFMTNLHRSLFMGSIGRFFVGFASLLLLLIAISGIFLIIRRQGSFVGFFTTIVNYNFSQYYHIVFGRWTLLPIVIITITGVYLSLLRFSIIPQVDISHTVDYVNIRENPVKKRKNFEVFNKYTVGDLKAIEYPFSSDVEDYYHIKLTQKEILVNQYTGDILSEQNYPFITLVSRVSILLHTGKGSVWWAVILGISCCAIPFFIYSGFRMSLERRKTRIKNAYSSKTCDFIIAVGSENGSTLRFANAFYKALISEGKKAYITELNEFKEFDQMKHLIVMTATYGLGESPTNATKFRKILDTYNTSNSYTYSVIGFGSLSYPDFCKYAFDVDSWLKKLPYTTQLVPVHTVNNQSFESFSDWGNAWGAAMGIPIVLNREEVVSVHTKTEEFTVLHKTKAADNIDDTFLINITREGRKKVVSGDLLAIYPKEGERERLYSIGYLKETKEIQLSVKKHDRGLCSTYLDNLSERAVIKGYLIKNKSFHFPKRASAVIMICTGTGIGPFLGMIDNNIKKCPSYLYWGARNKTSLELYDNDIKQWLQTEKIKKFIPAYSRESSEKVYVQHLIERDATFIAETLKNNGVIMICGSLIMQKEVIVVLQQICNEYLKKPLNHFQNKNRILMDCY
ncbi:FAD-binding oxidoreductase [Aquimarina sp. TRL1]|uniref:PepSY domain-containing protein n=1 Tax=Aquimarina sp. (strain TRL1) TaxID=2736252 RepID=UPI0015898C2D|nr:PepSY domain-containing protein [Aquimarina sp. TRL1]QKX06587.1 FAD-binding oxidoreductase [Aquimarina sp. TRL1]